MANTVLLEARPFRPFKSSEEYLYAMKEDLAEWLHMLYPELAINVDNFMDRIDTGVALCKHANNVKRAAAEYVSRRQARKLMTRSTTTTLAMPISTTPDVHYLQIAKPGTFFARDNVSNFIHWCRKYLGIFECLLFETDDLILRKNEKHVILCLLEVARKGAKFGMLAPMLVQMERQIDREIAQEQRAADGQVESGETDSEDEHEPPPVIMVYGPQPQIVTNDLKSLDEMVRDLVERCNCPTQFPMIRVSEGKYRIGDTKVLIFVRILRNHVMVRVGGGWDTLSHYLDKHDPCRCKAQHRSALQSRLINRPGAADLNGAQVLYERSPPRTRRSSVSSVCSNGHAPNTNQLHAPTVASRNRSRSPTPARKHSNIAVPSEHLHNVHNRRSASPNPVRKSPNVLRKNLNVPSNTRMRSRSPTPSLFAHDKHIATMKIQPEVATSHISEAILQIVDPGVPTETSSDNGSEVSDEGYRSLGLVQNTAAETTKICTKINRLSANSRNSNDDTDFADTEPYSLQQSDSSSNSGDTSKLSEESTTITNNSDSNDVYNDTGLRKTYFSDTYFSDRKPVEARVPQKSNNIRPTDLLSGGTSLRSRSSSQDREADLVDVVNRRGMRGERTNLPRNASPCKTTANKTGIPSKVTIKNSLLSKNGSGNNTWSGRQARTRPPLSNETFEPPPTHSTANFSRNTVGRTSLSAKRGVVYDSNGRRVKTSASANNSPTKHKSPLLEKILQTAEDSKDDLQMLEKIKNVIKQYSDLVDSELPNMDFTSAWVHSQGGNDSKRCSVASDGVASSSSESGSKGAPNVQYVTPRKDFKEGKISRIPAPVVYKRAATELY